MEKDVEDIHHEMAMAKATGSAEADPDNPKTVEEVNDYGQTRRQAWDHYHACHPEVVASWGEQNGRWPNCRCHACNPGHFAGAS